MAHCEWAIVKKLEMFRRRRAIPLCKYSKSAPAVQSGMNPRIPIALGVAGMCTATATAIFNVNGMLNGHVYFAYFLYGVAAILIIVALIAARHKPESTKTSSNPKMKDSFNPSNTVTANPTINASPTINVGYPEPKRELSPLPLPIKAPVQLEPNLILCRVWRERLYRVKDEFCLYVGRGMENQFPVVQAWVAEIKNASCEELVGCAKNIKVELVLHGSNGDESIGPLPWLDRLSNSRSIEMGDSARIVLAAYMQISFPPNMSEWRVPVNMRPNEAHLPGAEMIELRQWKHKGGKVKLNIFHPESGRIVKTFIGAYSWPESTQEPSFIFQIGKEYAEEKVGEA
jgi:hypothetical protein